MITITTRQDRLLKTIARYEKKIADLQSGKKNVYYQKICGEEWERWIRIDTEIAKDNLEEAKNRMPEAKRLDEKETLKLRKENAKKEFFESLPECLKNWMKEHEIAVKEYFTEKREYWREFRKQMLTEGYRAWDKWLWNADNSRKAREYYKYTRLSDEDIEKEAYRSAHAYILDLFERVTKYVGEITNIDDVRVDGLAINGYITGEKGKVELRTIIAGGHNIQCLHNRVIVVKM